MIAIGFEGAYLRQSDYVVNLSADEEMYVNENGERCIRKKAGKGIKGNVNLRYGV